MRALRGRAGQDEKPFRRAVIFSTTNRRRLRNPAVFYGFAAVMCATVRKLGLRRSVMGSTADWIKDIGPQPQSFDIERATKENTNYRSVAWSGRYLQVTLMSIPAGGEIGLEAHPETDQFLRLDAGSGRVQMGPAKDKLTFEKEVSDGWCVLVPAGTWHNITNIGATPMQVYAIYAPAHHTPDKVQATAAAAEADKDDEPAAWSVQPKHAPDKHG